MNNDWVRTRRVFHLRMPLEWNQIDSILAGNMEMPAAVPYPSEPCMASVEDDRCPRNVVKQQLFALMPRDEAELEHLQASHFDGAMKDRGSIELGHHPFQVSKEFLSQPELQ